VTALRRSKLASASLAIAGFLGFSASCAQDQVTVPVRSLERSGPVSFVCLMPPGTLPGPGVAQSRCDAHITDDPSSYALDANGQPKPHLYGLVTQTVRGEVAVVDVTAGTDSVLDQDPTTPGATFLPIGAQPVDIVSTPGSTAAFVAVAEAGRPALYGLPSTLLRPLADRGPLSLTSWPACVLPSAPTSMLILGDPAVNGQERASCDGEYGAAASADPRETPLSHGDLSLEGQGRQKLLVTLPDEGGIAVIDAQRLLDRNPGTLGPCPIDDFVPLSADVPPPVVDPTGGPTGPACVTPPQPEPQGGTELHARPADLEYSDGKLYVADSEAPAIHVLDAASPCALLEREPLLPSSLGDPTRVVTTSRIAVSPRATSDLKRYLYAVDIDDASAMVFDVSDDAPTRAPLVRQNPQRTPWSAADRLQFAGAVRDLVLVSRDAAATNPVTGAAASGVACDPNPELTTCSTTSMTCDEGTLYRTSEDYNSGAGPQKLRGQFAFLLLSSGLIAIADIEDYDAPCRVPDFPSTVAGCATDAAADATALEASGEASCNVVVPHAPRSATYVVTNDSVGRRSAGLQSYPLLADANGTLRSAVDETAARMRALAAAGPQSVVIGGAPVLIGADGLISEGNEPRNTLTMTAEDPRSHIVDQGWSVVFEAALPSTAGRIGDLRLGTEGTESGLYDATTRFCSAGVQSRAMVRELLESYGVSDDESELAANVSADYLQIASPVPSEGDTHWGQVGGACSFQECQSVFGTVEVPTPSREIRIEEAYQDHLVLAPSAVGDGKIECCFPTLVNFNVRPRHQWLVLGDASGYLHHVIADPATGACRNSCDPARAGLAGRVREVASGQVLDGTNPFGFVNPMLRFSISRGACTTTECEDQCPPPCAECQTEECLFTCDDDGQVPCELPSARGDQFRFVTQGAFVPLFVDLRGETNEVQPQTIGFLPATGDVIVTDGSLEGLMFVNPASVSVSRKYF
jgi:hypothetical protein